MEKEKIRKSAEGEKVRRNKVNMDLRGKNTKGGKRRKENQNENEKKRKKED